MPINNITEKWEDREGAINEKGGSATRVYTVVFDPGDEPSMLPLMALNADGVPKKGDSHPYSQWLTVKDKAVRPVGPMVYDVTVNYKYPEVVDPGTNPDPTQQETGRSCSFVVTQDVADRTFNGNPVVNSAGYSFDPPIMKDYYDMVWKIKRTIVDFDPVFWADYVGAVNQFDIWGFPAETVKFTGFDATEVITQGLKYWNLNLEFSVRLAKKPEDGQYFGWQKRVLDEGTIEAYWEGGVVIDHRNIKDGDGNNVTSPVPLNQWGQKLDLKIDPHHFLYFQVEKLMNFINLGV